MSQEPPNAEAPLPEAEPSEQQEDLQRSGRFDLTRPLSRDGYPELVTRLDAAWRAVAQQIAATLR